eukprot:scaffold108042_cov24-Tisochrysis_lutea.AAC.1
MHCAAMAGAAESSATCRNAFARGSSLTETERKVYGPFGFFERATSCSAALWARSSSEGERRLRTRRTPSLWKAVSCSAERAAEAPRERRERGRRRAESILGRAGEGRREKATGGPLENM